jgi:hypothetical protein
MIVGTSKYQYWSGILASIILGTIFIVASSGKLFNGIPDSALIILPSSLAEIISMWLPKVELLIGIILIAGIAVKFMAILSLILTTCFFGYNALLIKLGLGSEPCGCFGIAENVSVIDSLYLDVIMIGLTVIIMLYYRGKLFNKRPWYWG